MRRKKSDEKKAEDANLDKVIAAFKVALGDKVKDVRSSERLTDSACVLVADEGDMDMRMERLMKQHNQLAMAATRILELNPNHPLVKKLVEVAEADVKSSDLDLAAHLLLDQAKIIDGDPVADPVGVCRSSGEDDGAGNGGLLSPSYVNAIGPLNRRAANRRCGGLAPSLTEHLYV